MKLLLAAGAIAALLASPAQAAPEIKQVIYNVSATTRCSDAAAGFGELKAGLAACDIALKDPHMIHVAELMVDRGVIQARLT
jgi:opacity protein-like surface antigen